MKTGTQGLAIIKEYEGYHDELPNGSCKAYLDKLVSAKKRSPGYKGLWTIGWGCTGSDVTEGTVWTKAQAQKELLKRVANHERNVSGLVKVPLDQNQFDALVSLSYNLGLSYESAPTLLNRLNAKDYKGAAEAFLLYNKAGGKVVKGLVRRRAEEKVLFEMPMPKHVVEGSRKLSWLKRLRNAISTTVGGIFAMDWMGMLQQVKDFAADNAMLMIVIAAAGMWIVFKVIEHMTVQDAMEGRYTPTGLVDDDLAP